MTVPPNAFLTALKSPSSETTPAKRRCGPISTFSGVGGAGFRPAQTISPTPSAATRASSSARSGVRSAAIAFAVTDSDAFAIPAAPARQQVERVGVGLGDPRVEVLVDRRRLGTEVEQHRREVDARDAVDHRVVGLRQQAEAAVVEALDEPHLPQRLGAVELLGEHARAEVHELLVAARRGQRGVAHVVLEVEVGVVGPQRAARVGGREHEPLAVARHHVQAAADRVEEVVVARDRPLGDDERADVHVRHGSLLVQERRVDRGQPVEVARGHRLRA